MLSMMKAKKYKYSERRKKLFMSKKDILKLLKSNQLVGLHSDSHPINIQKLSYNKQLLEYKKNMIFFKKNFGIKPCSMSHPFGRYNKSTLNILKKLGIKIGFLSHINNKKISTDLEVPRYDHINILSMAKWKLQFLPVIS